MPGCGDVDRLGAIRSRPSEAGVLVDFDGTLSEIAPTPEEARPVTGSAEVLELLARAFRVVAVISGRRAGEVAGLLGRPAGVRCFGLYGLEDEHGPADPAAAGLIERVEGLLPEVHRAAARVPGARVEPKGLQVAVHYRGAANAESARRALAERLGVVASRAGLRVLQGKKVMELAPDGGPTKGHVVERLARDHGLRAVLYAGDDVADREAFEAVDRLREAGVQGVKVAVRSDETPEDLVAAADVVVAGPAGLVELLTGLTSR
jgi:trehalose 6-phosphate phosphatase